ncbi:MAG: hypothetical protein Q7I97_06505 [Thermovirgaceae bacterium]|nr:hypothetical protein [Thermovirgaceae bacterium]
MLRIRPGHPSGINSATANFKTGNLIGGLDMWHQDSAGKWYMAESEIIGSDNIASPADGVAVWANTVISGDFFELGVDSSVYLFSSQARGHERAVNRDSHPAAALGAPCDSGDGDRKTTSSKHRVGGGMAPALVIPIHA